MKAPPVKPHFFKPLLPGFKNGLKIPDGFLKYLIGRKKKRHVILKKAGKKWAVKLNGEKLEEGWGQFVEEYDFQLGDILVFRHEGHLKFDVSVFNLSHCDTEYAEYLQEEEEAHSVEETCKNFEFKGRMHLIRRSFRNSLSISRGRPTFYPHQMLLRGISLEAATHKPSGQSQFICTVKRYCLQNGYMRIPSMFAKANGLTNKKCGVIIRDERQRSWNLRIYTSCSQVYMGGRWGEFRAANGIRQGDQIMFEVVTNGEQPIWKYHKYAECLQQDEKEAYTFEEACVKFESEEAAPQNPSGQSQFVCTVKPYFLKNGYLRIPSMFAKANGLTNKKCGLIIRDERQRSWNLRIYTSRSFVLIGGGWGKFCAANDIKAGDQIMFEIVTNGKQRIWKFQNITNSRTVEETSEDSEFEEKPNPSIKSSREAFPHVEAATHKPSGISRFVCTIRPYCLTYGYLCLPKQFALRNGLLSKKCDVIIRDKWQRSWNLILRPFGTSVCIRGGWDEFREAYCLKEGDRIMFEVVTDGEKPIWKFHGKIPWENVSIIDE